MRLEWGCPWAVDTHSAAALVRKATAARTLYADRERVAATASPPCACTPGRHPDDPQLTELIGELSLHSEAFSAHVGRPRRSCPHHRHETPPAPAGRRPALGYVLLAVEDDPSRLLSYTPGAGLTHC
ncbi:hypothetical protein [Streptomyces sp900116325]|uniref:MmyB family transcriptional regulator n=1 Tax=Streptomyces sp. 900116325 TaxID=3154295 RepID=UPI0033D7DF1B